MVLRSEAASCFSERTLLGIFKTVDIGIRPRQVSDGSDIDIYPFTQNGMKWLEQNIQQFADPKWSQKDRRLELSPIDSTTRFADILRAPQSNGLKIKLYGRLRDLNQGLPLAEPAPDPASALPPGLFEKIYQLIINENAQNDRTPEPYRSSIKAGEDCDKVSGGRGEFGRHLNNPIPVNGSIGELLYISNLRSPSGHFLLFHRLGSILQKDVYETVSSEGALWDLLIFDCYHPRRSRIEPQGYRCATEKETGYTFYGTNTFVQEFPNSLVDAVRETHLRFLEIDMVSPALSKAASQATFRRPIEHQANLTRLRGLIGADAKDQRRYLEQLDLVAKIEAAATKHAAEIYGASMSTMYLMERVLTNAGPPVGAHEPEVVAVAMAKFIDRLHDADDKMLETIDKLAERLSARFQGDMSGWGARVTRAVTIGRLLHSRLQSSAPTLADEVQQRAVALLDMLERRTIVELQDAPHGGSADG